MTNDLMAKFRWKLNACNSHAEVLQCCKDSWHGLELKCFCMWILSRPSQQSLYSIMHAISLLGWPYLQLKCNYI